MAAVCHAGVTAGDSNVTAELAQLGAAGLLGFGIRSSPSAAPVASVSEKDSGPTGSQSDAAPEYPPERKKLAAEFARMKSLFAAPLRVSKATAAAVPLSVREDVLSSAPYLLRLVALLDVVPVGEDAEEQIEMCLAGLETAAQAGASAPTRPAGLPQELDVVPESGWLADGEEAED